MSREISREVKERVAYDLLVGRKVGEVNKTYGLSSATISNWRKSDVEYQQIYRETANSLLEEAKGHLKGLVSESIERLKELIWHEDPKISLEAMRLLYGQHKLAEITSSQQLAVASKSSTEDALKVAFGDV